LWDNKKPEVSASGFFMLGSETQVFGKSIFILLARLLNFSRFVINYL